MSDLKKRSITAIFLILFFVPVIFFGGIIIDVVAALLAFGASYELERMFNNNGEWNTYSYINMVLSSLATVTFIVLNARACAYACVLLLFIIIGFVSIFSKKLDADSISKSLLSIFYPSIGFSSIALIRNFGISSINLMQNYRNSLYSGLFLLIYVLIICVSTDMFAYFFGCKFGKHKLCPSISPKKSIEGSISGTVFSVAFGTAFLMLTSLNETLFFFTDNMILKILLSITMSLLLSIVDEIGDLFASKLKRSYKIKDYSNIFPGHGGILDRFDSFLFVSTLLLAYCIIV